MTERVRLSAGDVELELAPEVGGSIASFRMAGAPIFRESPPVLHDAGDGACFPLVPFSNRVRDGRFSFRGRDIRLAPNLPPQKHPLHGQGWRGRWTVEQAGAARAALVFRHEPGEWPWAYEARQVFAVDAAGLTVRLELRNADRRAMPCGLGLHPYFPADADTVLDTEAPRVWTIDDEIMPVDVEHATGRYDLRERRIDGADLDNGYEGWSGQAQLRWPDRTVTLRAPGAAWFQVYAPAEGGVVVIEPVTHANAALNQPEARWSELGLGVLRGGESTSMLARFDVQRTGGVGA